MNRDLMISRLRTEIRKKRMSFYREKNIIKWIGIFCEQMSVFHSAQIRAWHKEAFLASVKSSSDYQYDDYLQARASVLFLYQYVLDIRSDEEEISSAQHGESGIFKITA